MQKIIALIVLILVLKITPAFAEEGFPLTLEPEIKPKNFAFQIFYLNSYTNDNKVAGHEFGAKAKAYFLKNGMGPAAEVMFQHLLGTNPAIISQVISPGDTAHMHDASALIGYRFPLLQQLGITPFIKGRGIVTRGRGGDNLYGPEFGADLEWIIYPESTHLNIRYGLMLPLFHNYTGAPDKVSHTKFLLNQVELNLSYRFLDNWDVIAGYQFRQFPKYLGNSNLVTSDLLAWHGLKLGIAFVF